MRKGVVRDRGCSRERQRNLLPIHELGEALGLDYCSRLQCVKVDGVLEDHLFTLSDRVVRKGGLVKNLAANPITVLQTVKGYIEFHKSNDPAIDRGAVASNTGSWLA